MTPQEMEARIVRYGDLVPCKTAFIDAHTPGSDQKENFTIIGGGVSESPDQHVHIAETPGFNIGAAGQPPKCRNSLHSHRTAEVFYVHKGRWRFFWGRYGTAGEVVLEEGDIFNIPTGIFRGFENIGTDYGMIMAVLGGDDAGGGVIWAPQVIQDATDHGLVLAETGQLFDTQKGQSLPEGVAPMALLTDQQLKNYPEVPVEQVVPEYVGRYQDMMALAASGPAQIIGESALICDKPGFEVEFIARNSLSGPQGGDGRHHILLIHEGYWRLECDGSSSTLAPGDTCAIPQGSSYQLVPTMTGTCSMFRVINTDDPAGPTATDLH
ncbi:MAG: cupin domain-containing protein [Rhizobiaceae bacterium]|nr:cupin domain-containing protein [Rhizobiaceae bacterium]